MEKIKIVTYCTYKSLGSILQAYSLQKQLSDFGYDTSILMYKKENQFTLSKGYSIKGLCKYVFAKLKYKKIKSLFEKRMSFITKRINITYYNQYNEFVLKEKEDDCEIYISGSDQVWQPDHCNPVFFLDFVEGKRRISYAASMGKTVIAPEKEKIFQKMINNFDFISVREEECYDMIRKLTDKNVDVHIDPTFFISADEWRCLSVPYDVSPPYILLYMLYWDKECKDKIKELKSQTGLKVYAIADELSKVYADKVLYDVGVEEFLWLIDHAEYVITSSFHGTAFATIFNKKFSAIINPSAPSRISNLMYKLSVPIVDIKDLVTNEDFDYEKTNQLIACEKAKSIEYLKKVIV